MNKQKEAALSALGEQLRDLKETYLILCERVDEAQDTLNTSRHARKLYKLEGQLEIADIKVAEKIKEINDFYSSG